MNPMHRMATRVSGWSWLERRSARVVRFDLVLRRLTGGRVTLLTLAGLPEIFLTVPHQGSGEPRTRPVVGVHSNGGWLVVGSVWGRPDPPSWVADLLAAGRGHVEDRGHHATVDARLLAGEERAGAWQQLLRAWPPFAAYADRAERELQVFLLEPTP